MNHDITLANPPEPDSADWAAAIAAKLHQAVALVEEAYEMMDSYDIDRHNMACVGKAGDLLTAAEHSMRNG